MEYCQECGFCYNCDEKYSPSHKGKEQKLFQMDVTAPMLTPNSSHGEETHPQFHISARDIHSNSNSARPMGTFFHFEIKIQKL